MDVDPHRNDLFVDSNSNYNCHSEVVKLMPVKLIIEKANVELDVSDRVYKTINDMKILMSAAIRKIDDLTAKLDNLKVK